MPSRLRRVLSVARHPITAARELAAATRRRVQSILPELPAAAPELPAAAPARPRTFADAAPGWRSAAAAIAQADDADPIGPEMVAVAPWSMTPEQFAARPGYHVILGVIVESMPDPVHVTVTGVDALPGTVGELRAWARRQAVAMASGTIYGGALGGEPVAIDSVTITIGPPEYAAAR